MRNLLIPGETCWRVARAKRAKVLIDAASYFSALRKAILSAERSIHIVGWDIDSRVRLIRNGDGDDAPERLSELLHYVCERRPELEVKLLLWDYSVLYALEREPLPMLNLGWRTPPQVQVCLDANLPLGASHHQKVVVVDDALAFSGGLDLAIRRWDTSEHLIEHPERVDPAGERYPPFHDVQMMVDGEAADALAELVRRRWQDAKCQPPTVPTQVDGDPWPDDEVPDFEDVPIGISLTLPAHRSRPEVRQVEALYLSAIAAARRDIYIENQYLTAPVIADALCQRLAEDDTVGCVIVGPHRPDGWLEQHTMGAGRRRFVRRLEDAGLADRVRLLYPRVVAADGETTEDVMIHAKVMVVDDRYLRVGSSNLNNRSMGFDTECDLSIAAANEDERDRVRAVRDRLLGEHLGVVPEEVSAAIAREGSLLAAVDALRGDGRTLDEISDPPDFENALTEAVSPIADPEKPIDPAQMMFEAYGAEVKAPPPATVAKVSLIAVLALALALSWHYTPLHELAQVETLRAFIQQHTTALSAPLMVIGLFGLLGLLVMPVTVMILVTAVLFDPVQSVIYASLGSLFSASLSFAVGHLLGKRYIRHLLGRRLNRISRAVAERGVFAVFALRSMPVAPFTIINLVSGASHVSYRDFMLGTLIGMAPGIVAISIVGESLWQLLKNPSPESIALLIAGAVAWIGVGLGLQRLTTWLRDRRSEA